MASGFVHTHTAPCAKQNGHVDQAPQNAKPSTMFYFTCMLRISSLVPSPLSIDALLSFSEFVKTVCFYCPVSEEIAFNFCRKIETESALK